MNRRNPETLALAMDYAAAMEACAAYVAASQPPIREPQDVANFVRPVITAATNGNAQEAFFTVLLNTKNRPVGAPRMATLGLLDSSPVHPREVFREAVRCSAASLVLVHNHPSGDPTPSKEDIDITRRLIEGAKILGIRIVDHVIIGRPGPDSPGYVSLREKNLAAFE